MIPQIHQFSGSEDNRSAIIGNRKEEGGKSFFLRAGGEDTKAIIAKLLVAKTKRPDRSQQTFYCESPYKAAQKWNKIQSSNITFIK